MDPPGWPTGPLQRHCPPGIKSLHVLDADVSLNAAPEVGGASDAGIGFVAIKHIPVEDGGLERIRSFVGKDPTHEAALQNNDEVR
jgi:hypothetical protein